MKKTAKKLHYRVALMNRRYKRLVMVSADLVALPFALWSGFALRFGQWWPQPYLSYFWWLFILTPLLGVYIFARMGLYRAVVRFMGTQALMAVFKGVCLLAILMSVGVYFYGATGFPRTVPITFSLVALVYVGGTRVLFRNYYHWIVRRYADKEPVMIYGAGGAGMQLTLSLNSGAEYYTVGFIDDNPSLWGSLIQGVKIYSPKKGLELIKKRGIQQVLLALPNATNQQRKKALEHFAGEALKVFTVPSMPEIVSGSATVDQLREVAVEDLLGRDPVPPRNELLNVSIKGKVVMVTGAGGSIGSELCRQIVAIQPKALLLFDISEYSLYAIDQELNQLKKAYSFDFPILALLGSVTHRPRLEAILVRHQVQTIYHAAAYKHVPMVEHNLFEGIRNNVFGTRTVAQAALATGVERCVLVSTDKAVRPTNIMGATKRFAELIVQDLARTSTQPAETVFSMVRFGNVLGSSGSVVPLFRRQIEAGGPVTVTHPDITRYFMTIPEAASLVIQAGSMATGGEVFVLDMGEHVRIVDLARRMIELTGFEVKDEDNPDGDIELTFSGLRPGEKLYEELLIGDNVTGTQHPKIMRAEEETLTRLQIEHYLQLLIQAQENGDYHNARAVLKMAVSGFTPNSEVCDHLLPASTHITSSSRIVNATRQSHENIVTG